MVRGLHHLGYSERRACSAIGLDRSTYLRHKYHRPSNREIRHVLLEEAIREIHARSRGTYGMLRITAALDIERGIIVNKKLVWKLMRRMGLKGLPGPRKSKKNLVGLATAEDLVQRSFVASGPNELWLTDITEHPTDEGKVYCCCVLDMYSRRVVGWAIDRHADTYLVKAAITMAAERRANAPGAILHSDHGSQGEYYRSSQHLDVGGVHGTTCGMDEGTDGAGAYEVARTSLVSPRDRTTLLAGDREGRDQRGGRVEGRRFSGRRHTVVPPSWRDGFYRSRSSVRSLPVL